MIFEVTPHKEAERWVGGDFEQPRVFVVSRNHPPPSSLRNPVEHCPRLGSGEVLGGVEQGARCSRIGKGCGQEFRPGHVRDQPSDPRSSAGENQTEPENPIVNVIHRTHGTRAVPVILRAWNFGF
jgi:hypothetical protein